MAHPLGVALGEVVVDGDDMDAFAGECVEIAASVETRVLPSPVFISEIMPSCRAMPPMSCTSNGAGRACGERPHAQRQSIGQQVVEGLPRREALAQDLV